jgi:hypothetical protein
LRYMPKNTMNLQPLLLHFEEADYGTATHFLWR